jgi:hypothetical protein
MCYLELFQVRPFVLGRVEGYPMVPAFSSLRAMRDQLKDIGAPVVIYNKSHSGSRLMAELIEKAGVFMGAHQNESKDAVDVLELVTQLVLDYYPDYSPLWDGRGADDTALPDLVRRVFSRHLEGFAGRRGEMWGWKLCETAYIVPVIDFLFPRAKFIHLIRDGRDVAFSNHRGPDNAFWRKIYFNTDQITSWRGLKLTAKDYRRRSHIYNAIHWVNSVMVGRYYGTMLRERYLEVRYEDLCTTFETTAEKVLHFVGPDCNRGVIGEILPAVSLKSVGKYRTESRFKLRKVLEITKPLLISLGYLEQEP